MNQAADLKEQIEQLQKELAGIMGNGSDKPASVKPAKKGGMSAAGKARIIAAQKLRWAKIKAAKSSPAKVVAVKSAVKSAPKPVAKPVKSGMSAAAKAKLSALMKARWAERRAKKTTAEPAPKAVVASKPVVKTGVKPAKPAKKFTMSAAAKAAISRAAKARWAKIRGLKK